MMGPFVPDIITDQLNLIVGFLTGLGFGFLLEQAGFSSSRKLTGLFYGTDFTVLRVFFTAGITAVFGVIILTSLGLLDRNVIYVNPTFLYPAIVGGAIMGVGFVVGGFCPGTAFCGSAIGKIDAMFFVLGGLLGVFLFAEVFPSISDFYRSGAYGDLTLDQWLHINPGLIALGFTVIAVAAFIITARIEKSVNPDAPVYSFPTKSHAAFAVAAIALGVVVSVIPDRQTRLLERATSVAYQQQHPVERIDPQDLALRILDRDNDIQLIDVRPDAKPGDRLPDALTIAVEDMFGKGWEHELAATKKKIFYADDTKPAIEAATLARILGYRNIAVLDGGLSKFKAEVLEVPAPDHPLSFEEQMVYDFRLASAEKIKKLIAEGGKKVVKKRKIKKVQGGCGL